MDDNCSAILCWFLPYINMNQPQVSIRPIPSKPLPAPLPSHPSRLSEHWVGFPHTANSHLLSILRMVMYTFPYYSLNSSPSSFPHCVPKSVFYVCISIAAKSLQSFGLCVTPQTAALQAPPSLGFSRQEHWSGLPFPSPMHESEK